MSVEVSPEIIRLTQERLGEYVKKPALTEKLLKKPPFRFLHDVITAIQKSTGFFDGLFTDEELVSENVKSRESKIAFLNKVIDVVNIVTDSTLPVRSSKIIAGLEPEKTNELLQQLGIAIRQNSNNKTAIGSVVSNKEKPSTKTKDSNKKPPKKDLNKKPLVETKTTKNNVNKDKSKLTDRKVTKDKGKVDTASDSDKASVNSNKSDVPKKPKVKEKSLAKSKTDKKSEKEVMEKGKKEISNQISNDSDNVLPVEGHVRKVELTDILDDSDDLNSIGPELGNIQYEVMPQKPESNPAFNSHNAEPKTSVVTNDIESNPSDDRTMHNTITSRPQSRLSRQRKSLNTEDKENNIVENGNNKWSKPAVEGAKNIANGKNEEDLISKPDTGSGDSKTRSVRTSSSKKSSKTRPEPLKMSHSISIDSKTDSDLVERGLLPPEPEVRTQRPPSASLRPPSVRPSSARPGAPRLKGKNVDVIVTPSEPVIVGKVHVIVENYGNQNEDDDGDVEILQVTVDDNLVQQDDLDSKTNPITKGHGVLVQQILETQKELSQNDTSKVEIEWEYGSRREREASYKEIEGIRNGLQLLSRSSNPLGKLMDYIQEDVEVMRQELMQWKEARISAASELKQQQSLTEEQLRPLQAKLKQLESSINEQMEMIYMVKSNIHRNSLKIIQLVDGDE